MRGLLAMVEDERECIDILTQVAALRAALESFGSLVLSEHVEELIAPVAGSKVSDQSVYERVEGIREAIGRLIK